MRYFVGVAASLLFILNECDHLIIRIDLFNQDPLKKNIKDIHVSFSPYKTRYTSDGGAHRNPITRVSELWRKSNLVVLKGSNKLLNLSPDSGLY